MDILVGYGVGPRMEMIIIYYWDQLYMVARARHYYSTPFKGHQGSTQGYPIPPTIFNMVVDAVINQWVTLVTGEEAVLDGFGQAVQWLAAKYFLTHPFRTRSIWLWMS